MSNDPCLICGERTDELGQCDCQSMDIQVAARYERVRRKGWNEALEAAAALADRGMLMPPDGGSPTQGEIDVATGIAAGIRKLKYRV